jgi:hypothetical protein
MRTTLLVVALAACTTEMKVGNEPPSGSDAGVGVAPAVGSARWAVSVGTSQTDHARGVAIDSIGDVVAAAMLNGAAGSNEGSGYGIVTKRAAFDGSERWRVVLSQPASSFAGIDGLAIAPDDSIVVVGSYEGTSDFGGQTLTVPSGIVQDGFVAKYDGSGSLEWVHGFAASNTISADIESVAIDSTGAIVIGGDFMGALTLGSASYTWDGTDDQPFFAKLDPSGSVSWSYELDADLATVTIDRSDNVWLAGAVYGSASVGGAPLDGGILGRGFVSEFRDDGLYLESFAVGATSTSDRALQLVTDETGDIVVSTREQGGVDGHMTLYAFAPTTAPTWSMQFPDSPDARALIETPDGRYASLDWIDESAGSGYQVVTLDGSGTSSTTSYGERDTAPVYTTTVTSSATAATGRVASAGDFGGTIDFGSGPVTDTGLGDVFIVLSNSP